MRSHALALALCAASLVGCSNEGDYQVAVSWLINGTTPNADMCAEHGIARAVLEVSSGSGGRVKTVEGNCADTITLSDGNPYGGFYTNASFNWDHTYTYKLTLVNAAGQPVSLTAQSQFGLDFNAADIYELSYLDYVEPKGTAATLTGEWSFANSTAANVASDCAAQRVSTVSILATSALDTKLEELVEVVRADCATGRFVSDRPIVASGYYFFVYEALSDTGAVVKTTNPGDEIFVDYNTAVTLPRATF